MLKLSRFYLYASLVVGVSLAASISAIAQEGHKDMDKYEVRLTAEPQVPTAHEAFRLTLQVFHDGKPVEDFDTVHEKLLHLIIVSDDLSEFLHVHPEYQGDGVFVLDEAVLPKAAHYVLFADFTPTGDSQQAVRLMLATENAEAAQPELISGVSATTADPLNFHLDLPEPLKAGETVTLSFYISDAATGDAVNTLQEYLGAAGHLVIIDQTTQIYLHTHPEHGGHDEAQDDQHETSHIGHAGHRENPAYGPDIQFMTQFPATGAYALWLQVQYEGEIFTAPFVIEVTEEAEATQEPHHH